MLRKIVDLVTSLKLTIVCLAAGMALIFVGTIAQVHLGIHEAQQRYFQSMFVWWPPEGRGFKIPIFPGGHLIGAVLLINLIAAHAKRFRWTWRKLGIHLTHAGLIIMLAGGLFTDLFAVESHMRLANGDTRNYSEDLREMELAVIDTTGEDLDQVTAIPESVLRHSRVIDHRSLPFRIVVRSFYQNSRLKM
ncbi:MAG: ResB protein required for cytochrome C biosynthesis, partial [Verrucomicrobia bacterium]